MAGGTSWGRGPRGGILCPVADTPPLTLDPIHGPTLAPITVAAAPKPCVLGRSSGADVALVDPEGSVSRTHAELTYFSGEPFPWRVRDLSSRHGTYVNGERLEGGESVPLSAGDQLRIGPWVFRVMVGQAAASRRVVPTNDDRRIATTLIQRAHAGGVTHRRLDLLMRFATRIAGAADEAAIAQSAIETVLEGTGLERGVVLRSASGGDVEVIAQQGPDGPLSRSLIAAANDPAGDGETVVLAPGAMPAAEFGKSVVMLDIAAAVCAPILVQRLPAPRPDTGFVTRPAPRPVQVTDALIYLDSRGRAAPGAIEPEAVAFVQAVARVCGLALSNLQRSRIEQEDHRRRAEIEAARDVQRIIMPASPASHAPAGLPPVEFHLVSLPGRYVAGDLVDFHVVDDARVAVLLGDVVGKGVGAGMVMANIQAHLSHHLRQHADPARALREVGAMVTAYGERLSREHGRVSLFISVLAGVVNLRERTLTYCDAGHGYALHRLRDGTCVRIAGKGGAPLGVGQESDYDNQTFAIEPGERVVLFSDGLAEQRSPSGDPFGLDRAMACVAASPNAAGDVAALVERLRTHCESPDRSSFADDVTVASVGVG